MGQATGLPDSDTLDLIITNALIIDWNGIYKVSSPSSTLRLRRDSAPPPAQADIGINKGYIVGIGKGGNPDVMEGVTPGMIVGVNTEVIAGEKLIITAGAIDAHGEHLNACCPPNAFNDHFLPTS